AVALEQPTSARKIAVHNVLTTAQRIMTVALHCRGDTRIWADATVVRNVRLPGVHRPVSILAGLSIAAAIVLSAPRADADPSNDQIINAYRQGVQKLGLSPDDFTVALATFLLGCDVAYFNVEPVSDDQFRVLVATLQPFAGQIADRVGAADRAKTLDYL